MDKIWFIFIDGQSEGPNSYEDLKNDSRLTPDTWVWKEGFDNWKKIREVKELENLFKENTKDDQENDLFPENDKKNLLQDELVIDMGFEPPYFLWIILALIVIIYVLFQLYR
jgi:hypothetical protein